MISEFATDVLNGLQASPKFLKSKYFYDQRGDELFQQIMKLPEYYLTDCEMEILKDHKKDILQILAVREHFLLIDLGAGNAAKTKILLKYFVGQNLDFTYCPVDLSENAIQKLSENLRIEIPTLRIRGISRQYLEALDLLSDNRRRVILFLGASIGNFTFPETLKFLQQINKRMSKEDHFIPGFDLKKDPGIILSAYNDSNGVTRDFNLNLLHRINRELGANFEVSSFEHAPTYDQESGEARSCLISKKYQQVEISSLDLKVDIEAGEAIHTEISKKYSLQEVQQLAAASGFEVMASFTDSRSFFTDSVWKKT